MREQYFSNHPHLSFRRIRIRRCTTNAFCNRHYSVRFRSTNISFLTLKFVEQTTRSNRCTSLISSFVSSYLQSVPEINSTINNRATIELSLSHSLSRCARTPSGAATVAIRMSRKNDRGTVFSQSFFDFIVRDYRK